MKERYLWEFFKKPTQPTHRQYETLRYYYLEPVTQKQAAERFGYKLSSFQTIIKRFKRGEIVFFPPKKKGPKERQTPDVIKERIINMRKMNMSSPDIYDSLKNDGTPIGIRTIERILKDEGFSKLPRRTSVERGLTVKGTLIPPKAKRIKFAELKDEILHCQIAGLYLFIPYILKIGLDDLIIKSEFPKTNQLSRLNSIFSILTLKLIGQERLSQIGNYSFDRGFGFFAGLNVLPKSTVISTYSHGIDAQSVMDFQTKLIRTLRSYDSQLYSGKTINLDFHTIPHFGNDPPLENQWITTRNRSMKGALTFFAQDGETGMLNYARTEISRAEQSNEILNFINYWIGIKGIIDETLVFDSRLTSYPVLSQINGIPVKFITLRRRGKNLVENAWNIPPNKWVNVKVDIPKRKFPKFRCHDHNINLDNYDGEIREIIIRDHGRDQPTFVITNNFDMPLQTVVENYARRWRIENTLAELVKFFSLNSLSSPIMIRIHFDVLMTIVADSLYKIFIRSMPEFKRYRAPRIFRDFINSSGKVSLMGDELIVSMRKKAATPVLKSQETYRQKWDVPWWDGKSLSFDWHS